MLLNTRTRYLNGDGQIVNELIAAMYYDNRGRLIQTHSTNHMGGVEEEYFAYNFTGQPTKKMHVHSATGKKAQTEYYTYEYDHAGRLLKTKHQLKEDATLKPEVILAENQYDELGRLKSQKKGNKEELKTTFGYNIRSWTNSIASTHFTEKLTYAYSGNISSMQWMQDNQTRTYNYVYDQLSQLKSAVYTGIGNEKYGTSYSYDKHGNMLSLMREGKVAAGNAKESYDIIDQFTNMVYNGNQLVSLKENAPKIALAESADFKDYSNGQGGYTYNKNGALETVPMFKIGSDR